MIGKNETSLSRGKKKLKKMYEIGPHNIGEKNTKLDKSAHKRQPLAACTEQQARTTTTDKHGRQPRRTDSRPTTVTVDTRFAPGSQHH